MCIAISRVHMVCKRRSRRTLRLKLFIAYFRELSEYFYSNRSEVVQCTVALTKFGIRGIGSHCCIASMQTI